ncbi:MAG: class I SAM-dependent rRNA methyltransferase [Pontiella sp.]
MIDLPTIETGKVAIKLKPKAEVLVKKGHPWVFDQSIIKQNREGQAGDIAVLFDHRKDKFLACGFYDPDSPIRIKILQAHTPISINRAWFKSKIEAAYAKRLPLFETETNAYRLLHGENDGLPSLVADVYDRVLVVKLYSQIWIPYLKDVLPELLEISKTQTAILRLSRNVQKGEHLYGLHDGQVLHGSLDNETIPYREHGVIFSANVIRGHKTGAFLDHRENRRKVGAMAAGKTMLDVFAYAGGFSIHALMGGATEVTSLDISAQALGVAQRNAALNTYAGTHSILVGDAFKALTELAEQNKQFDVVVIDPPSFAKSKVEIDRALHSYVKLAIMGAKLVKKPGLLVLASCSSRVSAEKFFDLMEETIRKVEPRSVVLEKTQHDLDHPIGFPEGAYLKCIYFKLS